MKKYAWSVILLLLLLNTGIAVAATAANWQHACNSNNGNYSFDTNSVHTIGSDDVISAKLRLELSPTGQQALVAHYAAKQDVSAWSSAATVISTTAFNLKDRITTVKDTCIYDENQQLLAEIPEEEDLDMTAGSTQEKLASILAQWLYEN